MKTENLSCAKNCGHKTPGGFHPCAETLNRRLTPCTETVSKVIERFSGVEENEQAQASSDGATISICVPPYRRNDVVATISNGQIKTAD
jgi:hypothetical protein